MKTPLLSAAAIIALAAGFGCRSAQPASQPTDSRPDAPANDPRPNAPGEVPGVAGIGGQEQDSTPGGGRGRGGGGGGGGQAPRAYNRVITSQARTKTGVFKAHRVGDSLFYEIPRSELNKDFLLVTRIAQTTLGAGYGGNQIDESVIRWERRDNRILLRGVSYSIVADSSLPIAQAVEASNYDPIIASFNVSSWGPDSSAVVNVTRLFTTSSVPEFGPGTELRGNLDANRTFLESVAAFPTNIEVEAAHTYMVSGPVGGGRGGPEPEGRGGGASGPPRARSVVMHWSMVKLPENPMRPRLYDDRVGYFGVTTTDYGREEHRAISRRYIARYRLEKRDPNAELSEPVKPIVYYVDPATPAKWVPWIKSGIEAWQPAFEAAGFRNAIIAREAPSKAEDPDWSAEDARYSVIKWLPSTTQNASGPHVGDPRTGEILEADVQFYHNVQNLAKRWYFSQVGALDPRARKLPLPDSLMGKLIEYVVAHEVGHTLGFQHNMKASSTYPIDSIRNASFVKRNGHTPTLMDYSRFNYVAQPEDRIPLEDLVPKIGPYDKWATMWGYKPIPQAKTPDEEQPILDRWAREQDSKPYLRFSTSGASGTDPGDQTEAVGDIDAVTATRLGQENIKRLVPMLVDATTKVGESNAELIEMYNAVLGQWGTEMNHVVRVVGAVESQEKYGGQTGPRFVPVSKARQQEAVRFLAANVFRTPTFFLDEAILRRIEPDGAVDRIGGRQRSVLSGLLANDKFERLIEYEWFARNKSAAYTVAELLADVREAVWSELAQGTVTTDVYRRNLQRAYVEIMKDKLEPPQAAAAPAGGGGGGRGGGAGGAARAPGDARALIRGELRELDDDLRLAIPRCTDRMTRLHLEDMRNEIGKILDPKP
jgi:hypothetical protein